MITMQPRTSRRLAAEHGYTIMEMMVSMAILMTIMGATMTAIINAMRTNETGLMTTEMNGTLRTGMDLMVRDLLQAGQGLPPGHVIAIPSGVGAQTIRLPGPPGTNFTTTLGDVDIPAVIPGAGLGPVVNGVATDIITVLQADGAFDHVPLTNLQDDRMTVALPAVIASGLDISNGGPDDLLAGQLVMLEKGTETTLVQITAVDNIQTALFTVGDSLRLNQTGAAAGNVPALRAAAPPDVLPAAPAPQVIPTTATRIRMITYYLDTTTTPNRPRLVRRMNNGDPAVFNNSLGSTVAFEVTNLQLTYDLADGGANPTNVVLDVNDLTGGGACAPSPCQSNQVRKVNVALTSRGRRTVAGLTFGNTLASQVSLRSMAFVDRYR